MLRAEARALPAWPLYVLFLGYPVWWAMGLSAFAVFGSACLMALLLVMTRRVELPPGFALWAMFLLFAGGAATQLDSAPRLIGFAVRYGQYVGATIILLYVYNAREHLTPRRILACFVGFFTFVCFGGWLGVLAPHGSITTPAERLLPASVKNNSYVLDLVHPHFAEVQQPYGSLLTFYRPSAPFPYTNGWGCNVALLLPLVIAAFVLVGRGWQRVLILLVVASAVVPAVSTLNRGMFLGIGVAVGYAALLYALRGQVAIIASIVVAALGGLLFAQRAGVVALLDDRVRNSGTNTGRETIYQEAWEGTLKSPLFGYGAPRPSKTLEISVGTQGHFWNVMYSYGLPALGCFVGFFLLTAWRTRGARTHIDLWVHVAFVVVLVTIFYYGYDGPQLAVAVTAAGLSLRSRPAVQSGGKSRDAHKAALRRPVPIAG